MAKGDLVGGQLGPGENIYFQPASGVEIMITSFGSEGGDGWFLSNGTTHRAILVLSTMPSKLPLGIMNILYLRYHLNAGGGYYSGVQVK